MLPAPSASSARVCPGPSRRPNCQGGDWKHGKIVASGPIRDLCYLATATQWCARDACWSFHLSIERVGMGAAKSQGDRSRGGGSGQQTIDQLLNASRHSGRPLVPLMRARDRLGSTGGCCSLAREASCGSVMLQRNIKSDAKVSREPMSARHMKTQADLVFVLKAHCGALSAHQMPERLRPTHPRIPSPTICRALAARTKSGMGQVSPKDVVNGVQAGWFPQPCATSAPARPDQVITR